MRRALLAEFGAQAIYRQMARRARDPALADVLARLHSEEEAQIETLRTLMAALGARPPRRSRRRRVLAWALAAATPVIGTRLVLRICCEAEATASRWYAQYSAYLLQVGERGHAETCGTLSVFKLHRSQVLQPWVAGARDTGF